MKRILLMAGMLFTLLSFQAFGGDQDSIIDALKEGSAEKLSQFFDNILDVKLPEKDEIKNIGKNQAGITIKSFFTENRIKGFELTSKREMGGTSYITGKLQSAGKNYNITLMMKAKGDKMSVITVRIN